MNAVELRLQSHLSTEMGEMRIWLDQKGYEPSGFSCGDGIHVRVLFKSASQAQAFADRFGGRAIGPEGRPERYSFGADLLPSGVIG